MCKKANIAAETQRAMWNGDAPAEGIAELDRRLVDCCTASAVDSK